MKLNTAEKLKKIFYLYIGIFSNYRFIKCFKICSQDVKLVCMQRNVI